MQILLKRICLKKYKKIVLKNLSLKNAKKCVKNSSVKF